MGLPCRQLHHAAGALLAAALLLSAAAVPGGHGAGRNRGRARVQLQRYPELPERPGPVGRAQSVVGKLQRRPDAVSQSPIDLDRDTDATLVHDLGYLNYSYRPALATIVNRGHDIMVRFEGDAGSLVINGTVYNLKQLHWHTPAEHIVNGRSEGAPLFHPNIAAKRYQPHDIELHLVHESAENKIAVIGVLYRKTLFLADQILRTLEPAIARIRDTGDREEPAGVVDPNGALARVDSVYYRYMGSLTTPPCTEGVVWTVFKEVRTVASYQLRLLIDAVNDPQDYAGNARPLQAVNNRDISIFRPKPRPI